MIYFVLPLLLIIYFEILGQSIGDFLHIKKETFGFILGYVSFIAVCYISTSILTTVNCSFYIILIIYLSILVASFYLIFKFRKTLKLNFNIYHIALLIVALCILMYFSFQTSLGDLNGFDSTHYLNMVTGNIGLKELNLNNIVFGTNDHNISYQYTFQSFYYLASVLMYLCQKALCFLGFEYFSAVGYIWCFQILFYVSFITLIINSVEKYFKGNYFAHVSLLFLFVFTYGKLYFNNAFGFYGNTIRTMFVAYAIYHLVEYFDSKDKNEKTVFAISMLAACGTSSSAVFMIFFVYFALFFLEIDDNNNLFKEYAIILFVPLINLLAVVLNNITISAIVSIVLILCLYFGNDILVTLVRKYRLKYSLLILSFLLMFVLSYKVTHDIFDFSAFLNNGNERYDMTLDYFDLNIGYYSTKIYKVVSMISLIIYLLFHYKEKYSKVILILIFVFFNPFCCSFINSINVVYYRAYELILNPFTVIYFIKNASSLVNNKYLEYECLAFIVLMVMVKGSVDRPLYWHDTFIPTSDYNKIYKMSNEELNIIREINSLSVYDNIDEPKIITPNLLTQSMIPSGMYIYGREYQINPKWSFSEKALYDIFWPVIHFGDARQPENPDYDNMCKYIDDADIDFIVQPKATEYYDKEQNIWYSLTYKIDECGTYAFYDTDNYSVYRFER